MDLKEVLLMGLIGINLINLVINYTWFIIC